MSHDRYDDAYILSILGSVRTIAIVGASANSVRPSFFVLKYLLSKGYDVIPVNPGQAGRQICGVPAVGSLKDIGRPVDMVDIFRGWRDAEKIVDQALALDPPPKVIWMQIGVRNDTAAAKAEAAGVRVVMNRCPKIEYARLAGEIGWAGVQSGFVSSRRPRLAAGFQRFGILPRG
ncbi:MAG: CoA-binding protein [Alphaproteobacteria bacterium]|nr:MAG: CoA-binding protein [Alphaproteobacteria bacterium]